MLKVFAGYDPRVPQGFQVFRHSVERHASRPVAVIPLDLVQLRASGYYTRPFDAGASTPFSLTRFLVPALCDHHGMACFFDGSDMLMTRDIWEMYGEANLMTPVSCVQHDYHPKPDPKFFGQPQAHYPCKNWSSVMVFNCFQCRTLTEFAANNLSPSCLHQMKWVNDEEVGSLPTEWNWLAGEPEYRWDKKAPPALIHYTLGLPIVPRATKTEFDDLWYAERQRLSDSITQDPSLDHAA